LEAAFEKHLEDEASKPKVEVKKKTKEEILKLDNDRKQKFMEYALQKYNDEEGLAGVCALFLFLLICYSLFEHIAIYNLRNVFRRCALCSMKLKEKFTLLKNA
jgi:hypothetical protein